MDKGQSNGQSFPEVRNDLKNEEQESRDPNGIAGFLCAKLEKVSVAISLLTDGLDVNEPIRIKLRETALSLFENMVRACSGFLSISTEKRLKLLGEVDLLKSLLSVAHNSKIIRVEIYELLVAEISSVQDLLLGGGFDAGAYRVVLPKDFFDVPEKEKSGIGQHQVSLLGQMTQSQGEENGKGQSNGQSIRHERVRPLVNNLPDSVNLGGIPRASSFEVNEQRKNLILSHLQMGSFYSIKDITVAIPTVSEKTVQRELSTLVREGVLQKTGDRRWSRYSRLK